MNQTHVTEVLYNLGSGTDWYELMILQHIMWPSTVHASEELVLRSSQQTPLPQSAMLGLHPIACKLLVILHLAEGRRLS